MGADQSALVTADAVFGNPLGNVDSNAAFLVLGGFNRHNAVCVRQEHGHGQGIAGLVVHGHQNVAHVIGQGLVRSYHFVLQSLPRLGNSNFHNSVHAAVHSCAVHIHNLLALLGVALHDCFLHVTHSLLDGQNAGELEECGLQNGVGTVAQTQLGCNLGCVDGVELNAPLSNDAFHLVGQVLFQLWFSRNVPPGLISETMS